MLEFQAEAKQATASDGRVQSQYVAARAGFELRTKGVESTNALEIFISLDRVEWSKTSTSL